MSWTFTIVAGPPAPEITLVANAEGENPTIAPNTWVEVKGADLTPAGVSSPDCAPGYCWQTSDFVNGKMPTQLHGVSITVNGKSAYLYYISPTQVNILTPPDAMSGAVQVVVTNNGLVSQLYGAGASGCAIVFRDQRRAVRAGTTRQLQPSRAGVVVGSRLHVHARQARGNNAALR